MARSLRERIERACRAILPERPCYVLWNDELPQQYQAGGCFGLTGRGFDLLFREQIGRRWRGRRRVIILDRRGTRRHIIWTLRTASPVRVWTRRTLWQAASHELSHVASLPLLESETTDDAPDLTRATSDALGAMAAAPPTYAEDRPIQWQGHDGQFLRLLLHCAHRIKPLAGEFLPGDCWLDPHKYGLASREDQFRDALGAEPERLANVPLTELATVLPPESFIDLWNADVRAWWLAIDNPTEAQNAAMVRGLEIFNNVPVAAARCDAQQPPAAKRNVSNGICTNA